jgi:hypothetical protein
MAEDRRDPDRLTEKNFVLRSHFLNQRMEVFEPTTSVNCGQIRTPTHRCDVLPGFSPAVPNGIFSRGEGNGRRSARAGIGQGFVLAIPRLI